MIISYGLRRMWARTLSRPRWAMPMTHGFVHVQVGAFFDQGVHQRDQGIAALVAEPL